MAHDHNNIYTIVDRLRVLEDGLSANQRRDNQLSAKFLPKTVAVLTAKKDPKNPMAGKLVGGCEESEVLDKPSLEEAVTSEDVLDRVKTSFADYLKTVTDEIQQDSDLKDKKHKDSDIKEKNTVDRTLVAKQQKIKEVSSELASALSGVAPAQQPAGQPGVSIKETGPVKTIANKYGIWEVHGNESTGFEIRQGQRSLPTRFGNLHEAETALAIFAARQRKNNDTADYLDEA
jgi:hypothetical protein